MAKEFSAWEAPLIDIASSWRSQQKVADEALDAYYIDTVTQETETDPPVDFGVRSLHCFTLPMLELLRLTVVV